MTSPDEVGARLKLEGRQQFVNDADAAAGAVNKIGNETNNAGNQAKTSERNWSSFGSTLMRVARYAVAGAAIYKGVGAGLSLAKNAIFGFNSTLQQSTIAFTTMLGSGQRAQKFIGQLQQFAKATPFDFEGLVNNSQYLMGMGLTSKQVIPTLTALGDSVASVGGDANSLNSVILAFGQTWAKGKLDMGNMYQMMQNGLPSALKILAAQYHVTTGQMIKMIGAGKISATDAMPKLIAGIEKGTKSTAALGGMMDKQSQTFSGALSNIQDALTQSIAKAFRPFFNATSSGLQGLATWLSGSTFTRASNKFTAILTHGMKRGSEALRSLEPVAKQVFNQVLVPTFETVRKVIPPLTASLRNLWNIVKPLAKDVVVGLVAGWRIVLAIIEKLAPWIEKTTGFLSKHATATRSVIVAIGAAVAVWKIWTTTTSVWTKVTKYAKDEQNLFNRVMAANPYLKVAMLIIALAAAVIYAYKHSATFRRIVQAAFHGVETAAKAVGKAGMWMWNNALHPAFNGISAAIGFVRKHWKLFATVFATLIGGPIVGAVVLLMTHLGSIIRFFKHLPGNITKFLTGVGKLWVAPFKEAFNLIAKIWNNTVGKLRFKVPHWVPFVGGKGWSVPDIPTWKAKGGPLAGNRPYVVGENGPELFFPGASGSMLSNPNSLKLMQRVLTTLGSPATNSQTGAAASPYAVSSGRSIENGRRYTVPLGAIGSDRPVHLVIKLKGKTLADAVYDETARQAGYME